MPSEIDGGGHGIGRFHDRESAKTSAGRNFETTDTTRPGLEFTYNLLNLPCDINEIQWDMEAGMYQYWSDGTKKRGQDSDGDGHRYAGSFSYETDCGEDTGRFSVAWDEGRTYVSYSGAVSDRWFVLSWKRGK